MCSGTASLSMASVQSSTVIQQRQQHHTQPFVYDLLHCPGDVVSKDLLICEGDLEGAIVFAASIWPVLLTLLVALLQVGDHDNGGGPLLPHQPPKVNKYVLLRPWKTSLDCFS